jgi:hypothetical protein
LLLLTPNLTVRQSAKQKVRLLNFVRLGIPLDQADLNLKIPRRLPEDDSGIRGSIFDRGRVAACLVNLRCQMVFDARLGSKSGRGGCDFVPVPQASDFGHGGRHFPGHAEASGDVVRNEPEERRQRNGVASVCLDWEIYEFARTWLHKLRRAMVRPGRERLG